MNPPRILAFGAHPDDVEIYCLGLLLRLRAAGWEIGWAVATDGQAGLPAGGEPDLRRDEARKAGARVGVEPIF
jgi:LmbE family N-acetylglucosaminyl deacetylase